MRRFTNDSLEQAREVRLIAHATAQSNGTKRIAGCQHHALSHLYAPAHNVGVRRDTERDLEGPAEMADAESYQGRELFNTDPFGEMGVNVRRKAPR